MIPPPPVFKTKKSASLPLRFDNWSSPPARILWPTLHPSSPAPLEQLSMPFPLRRVVAPDVRRCLCRLATISITNHDQEIDYLLSCASLPVQIYVPQRAIGLESPRVSLHHSCPDQIEPSAQCGGQLVNYNALRSGVFLYRPLENAEYKNSAFEYPLPVTEYTKLPFSLAFRQGREGLVNHL